MSKKIFAFLIFGLIFFFLFSIPNKIQAESINVSATVPSKVSLAHSHVNLNANETLADPVNHIILLTVYLLDDDKNPLPNISVRISSNRGEIDIIEIYPEVKEKCCKGEQDIEKCTTDEEGKIIFQISSWIPGEVILNMTADNIVEFEPLIIKFLPLPFPTDLTLTIPIPFTEEEITILSPNPQEDKLTPKQKEAKRLANTGTKIEIPFWIFLLVVFLFLGSIIAISSNFINLRKIKKFEKEEDRLLKKIATHDDIVELKKDLENSNSKPQGNNKV